MAPSGECLRGERPPDRMLATPWRRLCLAAFGLSLVVAVLRDRLYCRVERSVLTVINEYVMLCPVITEYLPQPLITLHGSIRTVKLTIAVLNRKKRQISGHISHS